MRLLLLVLLVAHAGVSPAAAQDDTDDALFEDAAPDPAPEPGTQPDPDSEPDADLASEARRLSASAAVGIGVGARAFERPTGEGAQRLPDAVFAAAELVLRASLWPDDAFALEALLVYQSSLGMVLRERPPFAPHQDLDVRSARAELSVAPVLRLGESRAAPRLAFPVGFMARMLTPAAHQYRTPGYTLAGPLVRAELLLGLGPTLELRFGPEAHWLVLIDGTIRDHGVGSQGVALGAQAALDARVGEHLTLGVAFRQSHAFAPSSGARFVDVERTLTTRLGGRL